MDDHQNSDRKKSALAGLLSEDQTQPSAMRDLFSPFEDSDGYFILCVKDGTIVTEVEEDDDYTEYHIEHLTGDVWRIERADAAELCEFVYQGRIPDRAFFVALMNNQETPLPESWDK